MFLLEFSTQAHARLLPLLAAACLDSSDAVHCQALDHARLCRVNNWADLAGVMKTLGGLNSEQLMALDLTWSPSMVGDCAAEIVEQGCVRSLRLELHPLTAVLLEASDETHFHRSEPGCCVIPWLLHGSPTTTVINPLDYFRWLHLLQDNEFLTREQLVRDYTNLKPVKR